MDGTLTQAVMRRRLATEQAAARSTTSLPSTANVVLEGRKLPPRPAWMGSDEDAVRTSMMAAQALSVRDGTEA